jgi:hypothetical protein
MQKFCTSRQPTLTGQAGPRHFQVVTIRTLETEVAYERFPFL